MTIRNHPMAIVRAVQGDPEETLYWTNVHSDDLYEDVCDASLGKVHVDKVVSVEDIDYLGNLSPLLALPAVKDNELYSQLTDLVIRKGIAWGFRVGREYFETDAGRCLIYTALIHGAVKRIHSRQYEYERKVIPSFVHIFPAIVWAPLVHRLKDKFYWTMFNRQQHILNGASLIAYGLARCVSKGCLTRFNHGDLQFVSDRELADKYEAIIEALMVGNVRQLLDILKIDPRDRHLYTD